MKERNLSLDIIRTIACLMVILIHSPHPTGGLSSTMCTGISLFCAPCIGLFIMISGVLLLPTKLNLKDFIIKRLNKIFWPTIFFSIFYIVVCYYTDNVCFKDTITSILSIPFSAQGNGILWYMYTLIGLYLITPIISPFLEKASKKDIQFLLLLWVITLLWPLLQKVLFISTSNTNMLFYFSGYIGYFILGFYLNRFPSKIKWCYLLAAFSLSPVCYLCNKYFAWDLDFYEVFFYLSIFCASQCLVWFKAIQQSTIFNKLNHSIRKIIINFSNCSFGIYLIHIFIMRNCIWNLNFIQSLTPITQLFTIFTLTTIFSWLTTYLIAKTPIGKYIVGCKL